MRSGYSTDWAVSSSRLLGRLSFSALQTPISKSYSFMVLETPLFKENTHYCHL